MDAQQIELSRDGAFFRSAGHLFISAGLVLGITLVLWAAWRLPDALPFFPVLMLAGVAAWYLFRHSLLNLFTLLVAFILISGFDEGFDIREILFGLYYMAFLGVWYFRRLVLYGENVFRRSEERTIVLFLILVTLSFPLTLIFHGSLKEFLSEWLSLSFLALYFPIKEEIERNPKALKVILIALFCIGLYVLVRNVLKFQSIVSNAEYAFEIARGRAVTNETLLLVPSMIALTFVVFQKKWIPRLAYLGLFCLYFGGLLLTQSRGYWIGFLFGAIALLMLVPRRQKITLILTGITTLSIVLIFGIALFGEVVLLLVYGVFERLFSILTASSLDISLINRFLETKGVWHYVKDNPILGYGMGVNYRVFDIISQVTFSKAFIHNGYIALWYKFGIWGMGMMVFILGSIVRRAYHIARSTSTQRQFLIPSLAMLVSFCALFVAALTSNPFYANDSMFAYGVMAGVIGGCYSNYSAEKANSEVD